MESYLKYLEAREKKTSTHLENALSSLELALHLNKSDSNLLDIINTTKFLKNKYEGMGK